MRFTYSDAQISALLSEFTDPQVREATELAALPEMLQGISYFIDVGANVGQYVFHAARYLQNARVVAVEANPLLIPVLNRTVENLRAHDHGENTYEVRAAAVSDVPDAIEFHISRFPTLSSVTPNAEAETLRVPTLHLDELHVPGLRTLIKVDVEGAEYRAIRSGSRFLQSHETSFFVELHSWGDRSIRKYPLPCLLVVSQVWFCAA